VRLAPDDSLQSPPHSFSLYRHNRRSNARSNCHCRPTDALGFAAHAIDDGRSARPLLAFERGQQRM
jgi:hypothetical protein